MTRLSTDSPPTHSPLLAVVILAAGQGSRMYSSLPKVLHPLAGEPLLAHVLRTARSLCPQYLIVVYGHGGDQVRHAFPDDDIRWIEQTEQLGTGHAVKVALPALPNTGKTLILYADVPLIHHSTLEKLLAAAESGLALLSHIVTDPAGYGRIIRNAQGQVTRIVEEKDCTADEQIIGEINTGMMALPTAPLAQWLNALKNNNAQHEYYLTDLVALAVKAGIPVSTVFVTQPYEAAGVNDKVQLAQLERAYQNEQARRLMQQGVRLYDPARIDIRGTLKVARDVVIDINCIFEGHVELGERVSIGAHSILKNVTVAADTHIAPYSYLEGAQVGTACTVGPFARLRPGTQLAPAAHIGNFVEVKNSTIGTHTKVNHLSYIGDASVGGNVNVGAGCVTANYNGVTKNRTVIEDHAFIGSGSMLIAPVTIEHNATVAAGSVITHTAPANQLTLARARQVVIPGWQKAQE